MIRRIPWTTFAVVSIAALVASSRTLRETFIYDREKIFAGEIWRMFTGHWVHLSTRHLLIDVAGFAMLGTIIEEKRLAGFGPLCFFAPWLISAATLAFAPEMQRYCGLSALALAAFVFLGFSGLRDGRHRSIGIGILALAVSKILYELLTRSPLFMHTESPFVQVAIGSHMAGIFVGALCAFLAAKWNGVRKSADLRSISEAV